MRRRAVSLILCLCMVLSLVPVPVSAQNVESVNPFSDVEESDWFYDGVQYVFEHELMKGTSSTIFETLFEPERATQRGMIVTILYRLDKSPPITDICPFEDVPHGSNYEDAIIWAASNGIVTGYTDTFFGPYDDITRQQIAAILYRYANVKRYDVTKRANLNIFTDSGRISNYARVPLSWANAEELINGITSTILAPTEKVTRAQSAVILTRFCENIVPSDVVPPSPEPATYAVTFNLNYSGAKSSQIVNVTEGQTVSKPATPTRAGYTFNGWYTATKKGDLFDFNTAINADITLYAQWTSNPTHSSSSSHSSGNSGNYVTYYTVTFDTNNGSTVLSQTVASGSIAVRPTNPTRNGYTFAGWYSDSGLNSPYDFASAITSNVTLYAKWEQTQADTFTVSFDSYGGSEVNSQSVRLGEYATMPANVVRTGYDLDGWYADNSTEQYDFSRPVTENIILRARWTPKPIGNDSTDNDGNGIPDSLDELMGYGTEQYDSDLDGVPDFYEENVYGTDKYKEDTDGDGLPDGYEMFTLGTLALIADSDNNGVSDGEEDFDKDGLTNTKECEIRTNPRNSDTDYDGLSDDAENSVYNTNPLKKDTDEDGLNDKDELLYGMNPLNPITLNDGILDGDRNFTLSLNGDSSDTGKIVPSLEIQLQGKQIESLLIEKIDDSDVLLNSSIPGYLGNVYDLSVDGSFSEAILSFALSNDSLSSISNPAIFFWDNDTQMFEEVPNQRRDGNVVSAELTHFSAYTVLDKDAYNQSLLEYEIKAPTEQELQNKTFDVILALDESGSINNSDFEQMKRLCLSLLDDLTEEDRIGVITFSDVVRKKIDLSGKETAASTISALSRSGGGTAIYNAIDTAVRELSDSVNSTKIIILLTDGEDYNSTKTSSEVTTSAADSSVVIYTVGIGSGVNTSVLRRIAESTHGQYNSASNFSALDEVFARIVEDADLYKDSDGDGISDYHEKAIASGKMKIGNGSAMPSGSTLSYLNDDSDGDGLLDGEELVIQERTVNEETVYYCVLYSNPCMTDTDGDGADDFFEDYAGLDPLSNSFAAPVNTNEANTKENDWKSFFQDFKDIMEETAARNFFHNMVERDIWNRYDAIYDGELVLTLTSDSSKLDKLNETLASLPTSKRAKANQKLRVDLWTKPGSPGAGINHVMIWDVKPFTHEIIPAVRRKGINDSVRRYQEAIKYATSLSPDFSITSFDIGDNRDISGQIPNVDGKSNQADEAVLSRLGYSVEYHNSGDGLVTYSFKKYVYAWQEQEQEAYQEEGAYEDSRALDEQEIRDMAWDYARESGYDPHAVTDNMLPELHPDLREPIKEKIDSHIDAWGFLGNFLLCVWIIGLIVLVVLAFAAGCAVGGPPAGVAAALAAAAAL